MFVGLAVVSVRAVIRRRTEASKWLAATFGCLGGVVVVARFVPSPDAADHRQWIVKAIVVIIAVFPYCLFQFGASFSSQARHRTVGARLATALLVGVTLAVAHFPNAHHPAPSWYAYYALAFLADWTALSVACVVCLWRAGRGQPAVARRRMRTLGWAALALNGSVFISTAGGSHPSSGFALWAQAAGLASAILFVLGFVPPLALRTMWRREEMEALRAAEAALMSARSANEIAQIVLPHAVQLFGALGRSSSTRQARSRRGISQPGPSSRPPVTCRFHRHQARRRLSRPTSSPSHCGPGGSRCRRASPPRFSVETNS